MSCEDHGEYGGVSELVQEEALKASGRKAVWVRIPPPLPSLSRVMREKIRTGRRSRRSACRPKTRVGRTRQEGREMAADDACELYGALIEQDPAKAVQVVERARSAGVDQEALFDSLYAPAMALLGGAWASGLIDEAAFARAAVVAEQVSSFVMPQAACSDAGVTIVVGTLPGDAHAARLAMIAGALKEAGYRVCDVGLCASAASFVECVQRTGAPIVIVFAEMTQTARSASAVREALDAEGLTDVVLLASGGPFSADHALARAAGANGVITTAEGALRVLRRVIQDLALKSKEL